MGSAGSKHTARGTLLGVSRAAPGQLRSLKQAAHVLHHLATTSGLLHHCVDGCLQRLDEAGGLLGRLLRMQEPADGGVPRRVLVFVELVEAATVPSELLRRCEALSVKVACNQSLQSHMPAAPASCTAKPAWQHENNHSLLSSQAC